jgi:hypothetical protein
MWQPACEHSAECWYSEPPSSRYAATFVSPLLMMAPFPGCNSSTEFNSPGERRSANFMAALIFSATRFLAPANGGGGGETLVAWVLGLTTAQADGFACWAKNAAWKGFTEVTPGLVVEGGVWYLRSRHWITPPTAHNWEARWRQAELGQRVRRLLNGDHPSDTASCAQH